MYPSSTKFVGGEGNQNYINPNTFTAFFCIFLLLPFHSLFSFTPTHPLSSTQSSVNFTPMSSSYYILFLFSFSLNLDTTNNCNRSGVLLTLALNPQPILPALYSKYLLWMISSICLFELNFCACLTPWCDCP